MSFLLFRLRGLLKRPACWLVGHRDRDIIRRSRGEVLVVRGCLRCYRTVRGHVTRPVQYPLPAELRARRR